MTVSIKPVLAVAGGLLWGVVAGVMPAAAAEITVKDFAFLPATTEIASGQTVTWTNTDDEPHQVMAGDKSFRSPALDTGEKFSVTFTKPGTYSYYCPIHPRMTGSVIVH